MNERGSFDPERIRVQVRSSVGRQEASSEETVYCPGRERSISLDECLECHASDGLVTENGVQYARCRRLAMLPSPAQANAPQSPAVHQEAVRVYQVMSIGAECVRSDLPVQKLIELLVAKGIQGVPVVDSTGQAVGVISQSDLIRIARRTVPPNPGKSAPTNDREALQAHGPGFGATRVSEVMTAPAVTISEQASLSQAAALMASRGFHRLPVTSVEGRVVGVVTSLDLVRWLAHGPTGAA